MEINIGLDLGGDTLKIVYAYEKDGKNYYGKIDSSSSPTQIAIPAIAFFDAEKEEWVYGYDVETSAVEDFLTIVKIKNLFSLLKQLPKGEVSAQRSNREYYYKKTQFPKFYFPRRKVKLEDFEGMVARHETFDGMLTPRQVCFGYFKYVQGLINAFVKKLETKAGIEITKISPSLVRPAKMSPEYAKELSNIVTEVFGEKPKKELSSTKALALYARHCGLLQKEENFLMFDLGEETISVIKAMVEKDGMLSVDGEDGHSAPLDFGGTDVDEAVASYLEDGIEKRETIGTPSFGNEDHICERGMQSKQYLMVKI